HLGHQCDLHPAISSSGGAGTTGIYIDDTPIQMRSVGFNPDDTLPKTFDLQRVEILRGPQGTLFGAGAEGGAVRYILTPPSTTKADTYVRTEGSYTQYGQPNAEFGIARGQPVVDGVFGVRGSIWYRYDGGWVNRVDPTTGALVERNINFSNSLMARLSAIWQPTASFSVTPGILYQKQDKHDDSTFWPAYSDPKRGSFNTATPERVGGPDDYLLPSLRIEWDFGKSELISSSSYFHRRQITAYQGTVYDLTYYQIVSGCTSSQDPGCGFYPLLDANGIHLPAGFSNYQTPNTMTNRQQSYTQEVRWQSTDEAAQWRWTAGLFWQLAKEGSIEELRDTQIEQFFTNVLGFTPESYFGSFYSCPTSAAYPLIPACDIYYNNNTTFDRQIAAFGEVSYAPIDWLRITLGERIARTSFSLTHYADGYENFGPNAAQATQKETPNTPKLTVAFQVDPNDLYYLTYAKGFRVGGGNAPLPSYCNQDLAAAGYPNGAPLTYRSDSTQNFEVGSKNSFGSWLRLATSVYYIKWNDIQQSLYVAGNCGLQFTDNLGTAVAKGFDLQAQMQWGALHVDLAGGYTSARYVKDSPIGCETQVAPAAIVPCKSSDGDAISGQAAIDYAPGSIAPWTVALGAEYALRVGQRDGFVRADWEWESRNPWLAAVQDPHNQAVYNPFSYTPDATSFVSLRAGVTLGDWLLSAFVDNVFDSHTVINYALAQPSGNGVLPQQNQYTFRPRTLGITATWHVH
ncbi:MAG: TonB-dependent receptor, partial [Gammaproteobacteria bacterium]|nr:TonB-dependent receptor [Gammaproteobacteria bacterium]